MEITKKIEEALGIIWHLQEQGIRKKEEIDEILKAGREPCPEPLGDILQELLDKGFVYLKGENIEFTQKGEEISKLITRRHRLAERLLTDIFEIKEAESSACEFEHILSPEVTDSICTLLGHPKFCPHNSPIPTGDCCIKAEREVKPLIASLDCLKSGERGKIVYFCLSDHQRLHKLLSMGVIPGKIIHLHQTSPAFVLKVEETQIAIDEELARSIYVKRI